MKIFMYKNTDTGINLAFSVPTNYPDADMSLPKKGCLYISDDQIEHGTGDMEHMLSVFPDRSYTLDITMGELNEVLMEIALRKQKEKEA